MCEIKSIMDGMLASGTIYDGGTGCTTFYLKEKVVSEETHGMDKSEDKNENIEKVMANIDDLFCNKIGSRSQRKDGHIFNFK